MSAFANQPVGDTVQECPLKAKQQAVHWIAIEMVDEEDEPVAWTAYKVTLPNGDIATGYLDADGRARIEQIPVAGACKIEFPDLDKDAWEFIETQ
ncbi:MAG: hypothetical protein WDO73_23370 [Ignavibacteriota bacterium]